LLDRDFVITVHDEIVAQFGGLPGFGQRGPDGIDAALARVENHAIYNGLDDVFGIAALYAVAIAKGHVFNDANKRTGLTCALTYMERQGIFIAKHAQLEEIMVDVAEGKITQDDLADVFSSLWDGGA
jgi:death-on-curing protein